MVYAFIVGILLIPGMLFIKRDRVETIGFVLLSAVFLIMLFGLREDVGYDYDNYKKLFEYAAPMEDLLTGETNNLGAAAVAPEPGYLLLNSQLKQWFGNEGFKYVIFISSSLVYHISPFGIF